jgi:hypothetical protein
MVARQFEQNMRYKIFAICQRMGWDLDRVLDMNIEQFNEVYEIIDEINREEKMQAEAARLRSKVR